MLHCIHPSNIMNNNLENVTNKKDSKSNTWVIYTLVFLGSLDALYLTWTKVLSVDTLCLGTGKCDVVNASSYSTIAGVPIAALGLSMYLIIGGITLLERFVPHLREISRLAVFGISLFGFIYSMWLTYVEIIIIEEICIWCVGSAIIISAIFFTSILRLRYLG